MPSLTLQPPHQAVLVSPSLSESNSTDFVSDRKCFVVESFSGGCALGEGFTYLSL